jgi:hypothetical protein
MAGLTEIISKRQVAAKDQAIVDAIELTVEVLAP